MAEVLGIIAAVVGVADVGCKLSVSLYKYSHAVASPDKAIESISSEVSLLSAVLQQLGSSLENDEYVKLCKAETLTTTMSIADECQASFKELDDVIRKYVESGRLRLVDRLKWPYVEKKVNLLRANLERLKSTLILMLEVLKYARRIIKSQQNKTETDDRIILSLQKANIDAERRYENLLRALENVPENTEPASNTSNPSDRATAQSGTMKVDPGDRSQYKVIDDLRSKFPIQGVNFDLDIEKTSMLLDVVEAAQREINKAASQSSIWEVWVGNGDRFEKPHFRCTTVSKHPQLPSQETAFASTPRATTDPASTVREVYIAVIGVTGVGKSTFINQLCGGAGLTPVGQGPETTADKIQAYSFMYTTTVRVWLMDTPGFGGDLKSDTEVLKMIASYMSRVYASNIRLHGILYFQTINGLRISGSQLRNLHIFRELCGERTMSSVFLVMTRWGDLGEDELAKIEKNITGNDGFWGPMASRGSSVLRYTNGRDSAMNVIGEVIYRRPVVLQIQDEIVDQGLELSETSAGKVVALLAEYTTAVDDELYLE